MERVSSDPIVEKVPTLLEQLRQKRFEHEEKQKQQKAREQEEFEAHLKTLNITPLNPETKELEFVLAIVKERVLQSCLSSYCEFYLSTHYKKIVKAFPDWSMENSSPGFQQAFLDRAYLNLAAALRKEGLYMRTVFDHRIIQWDNQ